ncbi:Homeodomain-like superfamily protein [Arabidopsis thaliana]|uniref:Homeodomain-like superfamily protein n=1 Tax=Arabidopsis thaliana TaxID=3702 RepID=Q9ZPU2_ARATH|nr:Homeodomain-like superfamily protein [Arabidopsis thaliana]AAD19775.1 putative MYB family transcription factor [Arabidopsis thaliana]AAS10018.1 MYB transcription factor [Arabidopsis thaliana]AEC06269.1 Homeodomain-like superfamily protein [Arabidopsis thaliana]|eukprot:NP_001077886.1 Homeodomain-like superfamily protein [Arabidopsis thaliana]
MKLIDWKDCALMTYTELILGFCNVLMLICRRTSGPMRRAKGGWTPEEDETLRRAVEKYKGKRWKKIAEFFPERTQVQCLHRWQKVLNPELVKGPWTQEVLLSFSCSETFFGFHFT